MIKTTLKFLNDNHWYIIASAILATVMFWTYGCESQVKSLVDPNSMINRTELQNELQYIIGQAKAREENLDKQDAIKQSLLDAVNVIGTTGTINPSGLINLAASIGAIAFGLNRNQKLKALSAEKTTNTT